MGNWIVTGIGIIALIIGIISLMRKPKKAWKMQ